MDGGLRLRAAARIRLRWRAERDRDASGAYPGGAAVLQSGGRGGPTHVRGRRHGAHRRGAYLESASANLGAAGPALRDRERSGFLDDPTDLCFLMLHGEAVKKTSKITALIAGVASIALGLPAL